MGSEPPIGVKYEQSPDAWGLRTGRVPSGRDARFSRFRSSVRSRYTKPAGRRRSRSQAFPACLLMR